jgi:hypothetical protein
MKRLIVENTYAKNDNFIINNKWNDRSDWIVRHKQF